MFVRSVVRLLPSSSTRLIRHNPSLTRLMSTANTTFEHILTEKPAPGVALITLNRPKALNALCTPLIIELNKALEDAQEDDAVAAVVLTGSGRAFAAGADIKEMKDKQFSEVYKSNFLESWHRLASFRKPTIAAVNGFALGGGCEIALMCDIILASPKAVFGQPEINLGVIPGAGGTQRLTHAIGKSRAMEIVLTGRNFSAQEAADWGVASRVVADGDGVVVQEAIKVAETIASKGRLSVQAGKEAVNAAFELSLAEGLRFERRLFQSLFATQDQKEGMNAFVEKRKPVFANL